MQLLEVNIELIKKVFYEIVNDAQLGLTLDVSKTDYSYVRFNYIESGKIFWNSSDEDFFGNDNRMDDEYEAEYSNGTINYLPTLIVDNKIEFFNLLSQILKQYFNLYNFKNAIKQFGLESIIKSIILTVFSNARYVDYENPILFMNRYLDFFKKEELSVYINDISELDGANIITNTRKDDFGYETPYYFESFIEKENNKYYLPNISYGISDNTCYIYAIQNKHKNENIEFNKKVKKSLYKVNKNVLDEKNNGSRESILDVPPSFVLTLSIFLNTLNNKGINNIEVVTFLPDRYFEKKATEEYDADSIQENLTQRMVLLLYRIQYHFHNIQIDYPIYNGVSKSIMTGENLVLEINGDMGCNNNLLLEEVLNKTNTIIPNKKL